MWVKIDDKLHAHRKTRKIITSDADKRRDAAPMGLWLLAASWAGQNNPAMGWVPEHELDRWDDDWEALAQRLVKAGFWWPEQHEGEPGYGFVDWADYNPANGSSESGTFGNHKRWHVNRNIVEPSCEHCPVEPPEDLGIAPESPPDVAPRFGSDVAPESRNVALPDPNPNPNPNPTPLFAATDVAAEADRFDEWWDAYGKKEGKKTAQGKWKLALKKKGVTQDLLIEATHRYINHLKAKGKHPDYTKNPTTWLNGEHWNDEIPSTATPVMANGKPRVEGW